MTGTFGKTSFSSGDTYRSNRVPERSVTFVYLSVTVVTGGVHLGMQHKSLGRVSSSLHSVDLRMMCDMTSSVYMRFLS